MDRPGTIFTNAGASGSVTFTLPQANRSMIGWWFRFKGIADFALIVATPTADTLIVLNDLAADSLAVQTAGQIIAGEIEVQCILNGSGEPQWAASGIAVGHTYTIVTA